MSDYDVIIIGAGNGGLTSSATLARAGKKVLLLEKHNIPGGCATSFIRGRFEFETALHQLSGMGSKEKPGPLRGIMRKLEVEDKIDWVESDIIYRVVVSDELDLTLPADKKATIEILQERFPHEKDNIRKFFDMVYTYITEFVGSLFAEEDQVGKDAFPTYFRYNLRTFEEVFDDFFTDPLLRTALNFYWCYMGLPPDRISFDPIAKCFFSYLEFKPYHIKGGSQVMSTALTETILKYGGEIRFNCGAKSIILEDGRISGVMTENGDVCTASYIVSNISPIRTYADLMPPEQVSCDALSSMKNSKVGVSAFTLYIGLDCAPEAVGITEATTFCYDNADMKDVFNAVGRMDTEEDFYLMSCYNIDNPDCTVPGTTQISALCLKYGEPWEKLQPEEYYSAKFAAAETLLQRIEKRHPGFREHIEELEVATPITHMRYLGHPGGAIYGFEKSMNDSGVFFPKNAIMDGLYFAGTWFEWDGFQPTLTSGHDVAKEILRNMKQEGRA